MERITSLKHCYSLSFDIGTVTLFLKMPKWLVLEIQDFLRKETPLMDHVYKTYNGDKTLFANFGEIRRSFGFDESIVYFDENEYEIIYSYTFSPVEEQTEEICERCNGTKIDFLSHSCRECYETGKKYIQSKRHFSNAMLSLYPIVQFANHALLEQCVPKNECIFHAPETNKKQSVAVNWSSSTGMHNCWISAWIDDDVFAWLEKVPDSEVEGVVNAMQKVEETLLIRKVDKNYFRFGFYNEEHFGLQVPGNACDLSTSSHGMGMFGGLGHSLHPHNVDHRFQQIEFIAGLAVINDLFEKSKK